jgi:uncharacterized membrane protein (TIGR02234 family)
MTESSPDTTAPARITRPVSSRAASFALLLGGGGLGVVAAAQPWWRAVGSDGAGSGGGDAVSVAFSGVQATGGLAQALAVVALVGTVLILALRTRGRRVVGVLLAAVGAGIAVVGAIRLRPSAEAVLTQVREVSLADQFALNPTAWPWIFAGAGGLIMVGAMLTAVTAGRWPSRADRFQRTAAVRPVDVSDEAADVWKAMDAGLDPTLPSADRPAAERSADPVPDDPDVHNEVSAVTMASTEKDQPPASTDTARSPSRSLE